MAVRSVGRGRAALFTALFVGLAGLFSVGIGEVAARIGLRLRDGQWGWRAANATAATAIGSGPLARLPEPPGKILHPFLGYVRDPTLPAPNPATPPVSANGFRRWPDEDQATGAFTIAILGGSMAERFSYRASQLLLDELERLQFLPGQRKRILNYAMGGYKQPQQLATLTFLLSMGERPDVIINLDGFNEITLSMAENLRHGINPFYPRMWAGAVQDVPNRKRQVLIGELMYLRHLRGELGRSCDGFVLEHSALCELVARARDAGLSGRQAEIERHLEQMPPGEHDLERQGPRYPERPPSEVLRDIADHWARCSVLIAQICSARGIAYFHFLQPNQYVTDSKPMREPERRLAFRPSEGYGPFAVAGYPYLITEGRTLSSRGVAFRDLTQIYRETAEPVYLDDCCHVNERGNQILAREIAQTIAGRSSHGESPYGVTTLGEK